MTSCERGQYRGKVKYILDSIKLKTPVTTEEILNF